MTEKRKFNADEEEKAEAELAAAITAAKEAPADEDISGLGGKDGHAVLHFEIKPSTAPAQYANQKLPSEKPLVFFYLAIRGLGETPRLLLAEAGVEYTHLASPMNEPQSLSLEWRERSPNGLTPTISGFGIPRSAPVAQSSTIVRFLGRRLGMEGEDWLRADTLFFTAKDMAGKKSQVLEGSGEDGAKDASALARRCLAMLADMPDPADDGSAINYGQMQLFNFLSGCDESKPGCVASLLPELDAFTKAMAARPRIADYLASNMRFPNVNESYQYVGGPLSRAHFRGAKS